MRVLRSILAASACFILMGVIACKFGTENLFGRSGGGGSFPRSASDGD
jgi:hypothetical protein